MEIQDEEERAKHEFWKSKKWALSIIVRIFERYIIIVINCTTFPCACDNVSDNICIGVKRYVNIAHFRYFLVQHN